MKKKTLIGIGVCAIVILIGLFLTRWYIDSQVEALEVVETALCDFTVEEIVQIDFNDKTTQSFVKQGEDWINKAREDVRYNQGLLKNVAYQMSHLTSYKILKNPKDIGAYGINEHSKVITVYNTLNEVNTFRIGNKVPEENATYVWNDEKEELALVLDINLASIMVPTDEMIDPNFKAPAYESVTKMSLSKKNQLIMEVTRESESWSVGVPFITTHKVLDGQVQDYITLFENIKKEKVVEEVGDLESYGLASPELLIVLNDEYKLEFGSSQNGLIYFRSSEDSGIYLIKEAAVNTLFEVEPFSWIDKTLYTFDRKALKEVIVTKGEEVYTLQLKESENVPNLNGHVLDGTTKEMLLSALEGLSAYSYLSNTSFEENNPRPAEVTIQYINVDQSEVTLEFVPYDPSFDLFRMDNHIEFSVEKKMVVDLIELLKNTLQAQVEQ